MEVVCFVVLEVFGLSQTTFGIKGGSDAGMSSRFVEECLKNVEVDDRGLYLFAYICC